MLIYEIKVMPYEPVNIWNAVKVRYVGPGEVVLRFTNVPTKEQVLAQLNELEEYFNDEFDQKIHHHHWEILKYACIEGVKKYGIPSLDDEKPMAHAYWNETIIVNGKEANEIHGYTLVKEVEVVEINVTMDDSEDEYFSAVRELKKKLDSETSEDLDETDYGDYR